MTSFEVFFKTECQVYITFIFYLFIEFAIR